MDNDAQRYSEGLLREWKRLSEEAARLDIEGRQPADRRPRITDLDLVRFYAQCFDRPAFQDPFRQEGSMEAFDDAIEDTLTAINTGCLRSRKDGSVLSQSWGKAFLVNPKWRQHMDAISDLLRAIRARYADAKKNGTIHTDRRNDATEWYCIHFERLSPARLQVIEQ